MQGHRARFAIAPATIHPKRSRVRRSQVLPLAYNRVAGSVSSSSICASVDGFETPTLSHFSTVGSTGGIVTLLNNELLADATFLAGGFPVNYGDRLSSVLDIRLREGNRTRHAFEADVNFAGASLVGEGPIGHTGFLVGLGAPITR